MLYPFASHWIAKSIYVCIYSMYAFFMYLYFILEIIYIDYAMQYPFT